MASTRRKYPEAEKRSNGHSSKEKDRNSIRQVTTIYVRKLCPLYSLVGLAIVVRNDDFIRRSPIPNGRTKRQNQNGEVRGQPVRKNYAPATTVLYNSLKLPRLWSERINYSVHGSSCALHSTMRHILCCNRGALRYVPRSAHRSRLNARSGNGEGEHD